jgi:ribonuclease VapC
VIVDASALIEILRRQSSVQRCLETLSASTSNLISAANFVEACIVADNLPGDQASYQLDELMRDFRVEIVPVTPEQANSARQAHRRYERGSGSRARLNFGDCFAYALARNRNEPLLFVGDDFTHTDITPAPP